MRIVATVMFQTWWHRYGAGAPGCGWCQTPSDASMRN